MLRLRAFVMRNRHQKAFQRSVMLSHALQPSWVMQNMHDKPVNLPDPDIFAIHIDKVLAKGGDLDTLVQDPRTYISESHWDGRTGKLVQDSRITGSKYREKVFVSQKITEEDNVLQSQLMGLWDYLKLATTATDRAKRIAELGKLFPLFHFPSTRFHV